MAESKSPRPAFVLILICAVLAAVGSIVASSAIRSFVGIPEKDSIDSRLVEVAGRINATLPMMVNEITRLDATAALPGKKLLYKYTIVNGAEVSDPPAFVDSMRPKLVDNYKTSAEMSALRDAQVTLVYQYSDQEGHEIARIEITPEQLR